MGAKASTGRESTVSNNSEVPPHRSVTDTVERTERDMNVTPERTKTEDSFVTALSDFPSRTETTDTSTTSESALSSSSDNDDYAFSSEEYSSNDSLFEFMIEEPHSRTGTLKIKHKNKVNVEERKRRRKRKKRISPHDRTDGQEDLEGVDFFEKKEKKYAFHKLAPTLRTGDLCIMHRKHDEGPQYGILVDYKECSGDFPMMLVKGRSKFITLNELDAKKNHEVRFISASSRIFYGDFTKVFVRQLVRENTSSCMLMDKIIDKIANKPYTDEEKKLIEEEIKQVSDLGYPGLGGEDSIRPHSRVLRLPSTLVVACVYHELGILKGDPLLARPDNLEEMLPLKEPLRLKIPKCRRGPFHKGPPPLFQRIVASINNDPQVGAFTKFHAIKDNLESGDIVLMSGKTISGSIIRIFDHSEFSHIGLVFRTGFITQALILEASTNKANLVDIAHGRVTQGVELLPLEAKIFSGWYGRVAIRRLVGVTDEERKRITEELVRFYNEVSGRPYEQSKLTLILSSAKFIEDALPFLKNRKEDLSSLFCSELVAEAYQRMKLLSPDKLSHSFTPDDFSTNRELALIRGKLSEQIYIDMTDVESNPAANSPEPKQ